VRECKRSSGYGVCCIKWIFGRAVYLGRRISFKVIRNNSIYTRTSRSGSGRERGMYKGEAKST
jgi:hypothetical protein